MRFGLIASVAVAAVSVTAGGAQAQEWCGYAIHANAVVECGYTTVAECESAVGKGGMCFVDPDTALNSSRADRPARAAPALRLSALRLPR